MNLSNSQPAPYDPSPLAQSLQNQKQVFTTKTEGPYRWIELINKDAQWTLTDGTPLTSVVVPESVKVLVIIARGQGPSLAGYLYNHLKNSELLTKTIILSPSDGLVKDMRFLNKETPYLITSGNGQAFMVRFISLQRIGLKNFPSTDFDVAWVDPSITDKDSKSIAEIFIEKNIPTFIGPITEAEIPNYPEKALILLR